MIVVNELELQKDLWMNVLEDWLSLADIPSGNYQTHTTEISFKNVFVL